MLDSKGFDLWADEYDHSVGLCEEDDAYPFAGYRSVLNSIYQKIRNAPSIVTVLDIGFGTATLTSKLYDDGYRITGLDFSSRMIEIAKARMPDARLIKHDISQGFPASLGDEKSDCIVSTYALHHLEDSAKITFIQTLSQHLSHDGMILIGDVAFPDRVSLERCKTECGDEWDDDEIYWVAEELIPFVNANVQFEAKSYCAGVFEITKDVK